MVDCGCAAEEVGDVGREGEERPGPEGERGLCIADHEALCQFYRITARKFLVPSQSNTSSSCSIFPKYKILR